MEWEEDDCERPLKCNHFKSLSNSTFDWKLCITGIQIDRKVDLVGKMCLSNEDLTFWSEFLAEEYILEIPYWEKCTVAK